MKRTFRSLIALAIAVVTLAACSSSDDASKYVADVTLPSGTEKTEDADILVEAGAHEFTFNIQTEGQWTVTSQNRFLHVKNGSGTGNATVTVRVENNTFEDRKLGALDITFPGHESENKTITVEQKYLGDYGGNAANIIELNNKIYGVGFSYDIKGEWASPNSVKVEIFDTDSLIKSGILATGVPQMELSDYTITGSTISEVSNKLCIKASVEGSYGAFQAEANASFDMETSESSTYEYASTYFDIQLYRASLSKSPQTLILDYMTDDAYNAINGKPVKTKRGMRNVYPNTREGFKKLIDDFGTHVIVEAGLGGRLRRSMQVNTSEITSSYDVKAFAKAGYDGVCKAEASVDEHFKQSYKENAKSIKTSMSVLGGDKNLALNLIAEGGFNSKNYSAWQKSVQDTAMTIVNFSSKSLVPLYELVDREATMEYDGFNGEDRYKALKDYMTDGSIGVDFSTYKCGTVTEFTVPSFADAKYNETLIKDIYLDGQWVGQVCNEYIPNINRDERVTVVYPVVNNKPRYNMGFYMGDGKSHKPARVSWDGTNVAVEAYEELDYGAATKVYLRGASVMPRMPEGTTALKADDPRDAYLEMTDYKYPLVKIFNNVWMRENWHSTPNIRKYDCVVIMDGNKVTVTNQWFKIPDIQGECYFPAGWKVPSKDDFADIQSKIVNNGFTRPVEAFLNGGVIGFEACMVGTENRDHTKPFDSDDWPTTYFKPAEVTWGVQISEHGTNLNIFDEKWDHGDSHCVRLIKK